MAIQSQELHLEGFTVPMDVNNRSDIPSLQVWVGNLVCERDAAHAMLLASCS